MLDLLAQMTTVEGGIVVAAIGAAGLVGAGVVKYLGGQKGPQPGHGATCATHTEAIQTLKDTVPKIFTEIKDLRKDFQDRLPHRR